MILPRALSAIMRCRRRLGEEEHRLQIGVDHRVPVCLGEVDASARRMMPALLTRMSIPPSCPTRLVDDRAATGSMVDRSAAMIDRAGGRVLRSCATVSSQASGRPRRFRARLGERHGDRLADAGIGAGDERDLAGKIERTGHARHQLADVEDVHVGIVLFSPAIAQMKA